MSTISKALLNFKVIGPKSKSHKPDFRIFHHCEIKPKSLSEG